MVYNLLRYFTLILNQLLLPTVQPTYYLFCHPLKKSINKVDIFSTAKKNSTCDDAQETKFSLFFTEQKMITPKKEINPTEDHSFASCDSTERNRKFNTI